MKPRTQKQIRRAISHLEKAHEILQKEFTILRADYQLRGWYGPLTDNILSMQTAITGVLIEYNFLLEDPKPKTLYEIFGEKENETEKRTSKTNRGAETKRQRTSKIVGARSKV